MDTRVYFCTNRNPIPDPVNPQDFGPSFSVNGLQDLRFGWADVDGTTVSALHVAQETAKGQVVGSLSLFDAVKKEMMANKRDTLIFIHGFNTTFDEALITASRVKNNFEKYHPINIVVFSWPSDGHAVPWQSYLSDRHDAEASAAAFARGILKLSDFLKVGEACGQELHLLCHSMGNYVLRNAIQAMLKIQNNRIPRLFKNIFLMAADEDDDALETEDKLLPVIHLTKELYVYFNRGDVALKTSDWTKGNPDRLGSNGPRYPLNVANKVTLIDCTNVVDNSKEVGHSYFHNNDIVVRDLLFVLLDTDDDQIPNRTYDQRKNKYILLDPGDLQIRVPRNRLESIE